jgi:hypothetical protein
MLSSQRRRNDPALILLYVSVSFGCCIPVLCARGAHAAQPDESGASSQSNAITACVESHTSGQELRQEGKLLESRAQFLRCSQETCPELVRSECLSSIDELRSQIPSVVFRVSVDGEARSDVAASMDGQELFSEIPTRALEVNPGKHRFVFRFGQLDAIERQVTITEGEKLVPVSAAFSSSPAADAAELELPQIPSEHRPIPLPVYVLSGVGVLGLGGFVGFGLATRSKEGELRSSCSPSCARSEIDALENRALFADISLGIGIAALAAATAYYFLRPTESIELAAMLAPNGGVQSQLRVTF